MAWTGHHRVDGESRRGFAQYCRQVRRVKRVRVSCVCDVCVCVRARVRVLACVRGHMTHRVLHLRDGKLTKEDVVPNDAKAEFRARIAGTLHSPLQLSPHICVTCDTRVQLMTHLCSI